MAAAIETDDLTKDFLVGFWRPRPYPALHGLTMQVEPGGRLLQIREASRERFPFENPSTWPWHDG